MDTTTIAAGSVCGGRRIIQVFPEGVRVLGEFFFPLSVLSMSLECRGVCKSFKVRQARVFAEGVPRLGELVLAAPTARPLLKDEHSHCCLGLHEGHSCWVLAPDGRLLLASHHTPSLFLLLNAANGEVSQDFWAADLSGAAAAGDGAQQAQQGPAGAAAATVAAASILDPYVLVRLTDGTAVLLEADAATGALRFHWLGWLSTPADLHVCCNCWSMCAFVQIVI